MKRIKLKQGTKNIKQSKSITAASDERNDSDSISDNNVDINKKATRLPAYRTFEEFVEHLIAQRNKTAFNILKYPFKKKRVRLLSQVTEVKDNCSGGVVYWMSRDARVQDNWALLFAQRLALKLELPLTIAFCLVPELLNATIRHYKFMLDGLQEVEKECEDLNIPFFFLLGSAAEKLSEFVLQNDAGAVICDFIPLREHRKWVDDVSKALPKDVTLTQVDAHNIVPVWVTSDKQEYGARTIRNKINSKLNEFLTEFPPVIRHPFNAKFKCEKIDWQTAQNMLQFDMSVDKIHAIKAGSMAAYQQLYDFCLKRLHIFDAKRNDPTVDAVSGLSPWFHFGHISVQRCILEVKRFQTKHKAPVASFCEEAIIRRELADNFCYYNENYDNLNGLYAWAFKTLNDHRKDKRDPTYTLEEFENARTHDDLWNSAQLQLVREGKIHGFLRMYWAKKILEWTATPEQALDYAIFMNDKYSLDGHDPNGYVGCMWSIGGIHDQGWTERAIFGKIRYMNYQGCERKFDVDAFVARYGGKIYKK